MLSKKSKYEVAGEAGSGREGLQLVKKLKPDLVLLDLSLPDIRGLDLIRDIQKTHLFFSIQCSFPHLNIKPFSVVFNTENNVRV
ncbi:response regulator [Thermodesulfobacteriota bacterium]